MYLENKLKTKYNISYRINTNNGFVWCTNDNKIIKAFHVSNKKDYNKIKKYFTYLKSLNNNSLAKIYEFDFISILENEKTYFYYVMEKLNKLPSNYGDDKFFQDILNYYCYDHRKCQIPKFLDSKVISFIENIRNIKYKYTDFHVKNVMVDDDHNYKLIDLESFVIDYCY